MPDSVILHGDMNSFYASVEMMLNPSLAGKAIAVCGSTEERHGIILAKSEAAKKAGVKTGQANWEARQACPGLILVPPQYDQYVKYSNLAREIYSRYTNLVEPFGMDECWLDVTDSRTFGTGREIAEEIRRSVREELGLTVSIGVSFSKIFAKFGSDMKKPDAVTEISRDNYKDLVWPLPASDLLYIGRSTAAKLASFGIHTVGAVAGTDPALLRTWFGINGVKLWYFANGTDMSRVMPSDFVSPIKSVGHGITCVCDLEDDESVWKVILELSQDVGHRLRVHGLSARGVQLSIRGTDLGGCQFQCRIPYRTQLPSELAAAAYALYRDKYDKKLGVRALCVRGIDLISADDPAQLTVFADTEKLDRRDRLEVAVEDVRRRFGKRSLTYGILMGDLKMPGDGRDLVRMPNPMYT